MFNMTRRTCLKLVSAAGVTSLFPSLTSASLVSDRSLSRKESEVDSESYSVVEIPNFDILLHRITAANWAADYLLAEIRNVSHGRSTLRYIYPGVIHQGGNAYDLNAMLAEDDGELTLDSGQHVYRRLDQMKRPADRLNPPVQISKSGVARIIEDPLASANQKAEVVVRSVFA